MKKIKGKYKTDQNFTTVYCDDTIYTIARNTGDWGSVEVGQTTATGHIITQEIYDRWASECESEGTFELSE